MKGKEGVKEKVGWNTGKEGVKEKVGWNSGEGRGKGESRME